ncbi:hypothetical protein [Lentibacillus saliphilus]|uniref:hypothetical protein n=1 Tax=Lentibacillus saliphilus TaxID=2737028 RepID=UPI001C2F8EBA|nr:hypothetical protein [Lentibacillus saliphilus]
MSEKRKEALGLVTHVAKVENAIEQIFQLLDDGDKSNRGIAMELALKTSEDLEVIKSKLIDLINQENKKH